MPARWNRCRLCWVLHAMRPDISSSLGCCLTTGSSFGRCREPLRVSKPGPFAHNWRSKEVPSMIDAIEFIPIYTDAVFAEPALATARRLLTSQHRFYCYRFDRVSPGAAESNFLAQHTAELRYLFGTLTADGYDGTDRRISAWMQAQWVAFARDGAPADGAAWRPYGGDERIL